MQLTLIKFKQKRQARLFLRKFFDRPIKLSSLYKLDGFYYLLIGHECGLNPKLEIFDQISINDVTVLIINNLVIDENILCAWAKSEIEQSMMYIKYESDSKPQMNNSLNDYSGRALVLADSREIIRSDEYLTDIMVILNYTPDSFSDGGIFNQIDKAREQILSQVNHGATIVDIGVESTRPGAIALNSNDEINLLKQILPIVFELKAELNFLLSIDTYHVDTVTWLLDTDTNVDIINDVSGNLSPRLIAKLIKKGKRYIAMHNLGIPASHDKIISPGSDPIQVISSFIDKKITQLLDYGINQNEIEESVIFDPGIGFGNNPAQAWYILNNLAKLNTHSCELLVGHSRKSLFKHITNKTPEHRDLVTAMVAAEIMNEVDYIRLHDITILNAVYPAYRAVLAG